MEGTQLKSNNKNGNCNPAEKGGGKGREGSLLYSSVNINVLCCSPLHRTVNAILFFFFSQISARVVLSESCLPEFKNQAF